MRLAASFAALVLPFVIAIPLSGAKEPSPTPSPSFDWSGVWAVFDDGVDLVNLAVAHDGTVATTRALPNATRAEVGRWEGTDDALFIRYESGRGETILRHASGYRHVARAEDPGSGERRTRVGSAFRLSSRTVPYVGAWLVGTESDAPVLVLRSDGTGERATAPRVPGLWHVADGGAAIRWQDGAEEIFDPSKPGVRRAGPKANAASPDDE